MAPGTDALVPPHAGIAGRVVTADAGVRVLLGVRGMDDEESRERVRAALGDVPGVLSVRPGDARQVEVRYDDTEATVMDMIRALRRLGFLAGME